MNFGTCTIFMFVYVQKIVQNEDDRNDRFSIVSENCRHTNVQGIWDRKSLENG